MSTTPGWEVVRRRGTAAELHGLEIPEHPPPSAWILESTAPALVLGSAQPADDVDDGRLAAAGLDLVRRRSGGGAVLVRPHGCVWVDLLIPAGHERWDPDIGRAMHWVGDVWAAALASVGVAGEVHRGGLRVTPWSSRVCFAGLGPGEVVDEHGRKLVGISQRRTRTAARFQTVVYGGPDGAAAMAGVADVLALGGPERAELRAVLGATTAVVDATDAALADALVAHLPIPT